MCQQFDVNNNFICLKIERKVRELRNKSVEKSCVKNKESFNSFSCVVFFRVNSLIQYETFANSILDFDFEKKNCELPRVKNIYEI